MRSLACGVGVFVVSSFTTADVALFTAGVEVTIVSSARVLSGLFTLLIKLLPRLEETGV